MAQISVSKDKVSQVIANIESEGGKVFKSRLADNGKEVILFYIEPTKTPVNTPTGPTIETNAAPDAPAMNKVITPNIDKPLVTEITEK